MEEDFVKLINQNQGILQRICNIYFYQHPCTVRIIIRRY